MDEYQYTIQDIDATAWLAIDQGNLALLANILYATPPQRHTVDSDRYIGRNHPIEETEDHHGVY